MTMKLLLGRSQRSATARTCRAASFGSRRTEGVPPQARASWKPIAGARKAEQRHIACFKTIPEAAQAVRDTEALLAAGGNPWADRPVRKRKPQARRGACTLTPCGVSLCDAIFLAASLHRHLHPSGNACARLARPRPRPTKAVLPTPAIPSCPRVSQCLRRRHRGYQWAHGCLLGRGRALPVCATGDLSAAARLQLPLTSFLEGAPVSKVACNWPW